jgi:hypothetical protein
MKRTNAKQRLYAIKTAYSRGTLGASGRECEGKIVNLNVEPDF